MPTRRSNHMRTLLIDQLGAGSILSEHRDVQVLSSPTAAPAAVVPAPP